MVGRFFSRMLALAAFFALAGTAQAQQGSISGKVTEMEGGKAIAGARVQAVSGLRIAASVVSGDDGSYRITGLATGTYNVIATRIGFSSKRAEGIAVSASGATTANFAMAAVAAQLNQVVTTASRGTKPEKILDAPVSISLVTSEQLSNNPAPTIADAMKTTPGLSVSQGGIVQSNIVSRGFNNAFSGAMLVLQDYRFAGVPSLRVNVPLLFTGTSEDIDRIEILNGPASALYGPNSANGVLHIITKSPFNSQGTTITLDGGTQSIMRAGLRHAGVFGDKKWGYKLSGEYFTGTDWQYKDPNDPAVYPSTAPAGRAGTAVARDYNVKRYSGEARLDWRPTDETENILSAGYTMAGSGLEITTAFGPTQVKNWSYQSFQDRFRYKKFFAQVFFNGNNSGNKNGSDLGGTYYLDTGLPVVDKSTVLNYQVQQGFDLGASKNVIGIDAINTAPRSAGTIFGRNEGNTDITEMGAYLQSTMPLTPKVDFVAAVRGDQTNRLAGTQFSPRAAFVYKYDDVNNFRFTFSRAFNSPASFSYFLDQIQNPNAAPGFPLRAIGNPAKEGWQFNRSCDATVNSGLCMHSPWVATGPTTNTASTASAAFPGFIAALPTIINGLPTLSAAQKAGLIGLLGQLNPILSSLRPTPAQLGTVLRIGASQVQVTDVKDLQPLQASFNNTWELGYKGIINNRLRVAIDLWYQLRGDVGTPIGQANPLVFYDPTTLAGYLATNITNGMIASGASPAVAQGTAAAAVGALVPLMAQLPQGVLAFTNPKLGGDQSIIATYQNGKGTLDVRGFDLAVDYQANDKWLFSSTYSHMGQNVFPQIGGTVNPLMANSPKHRVTGTSHYMDETNGWGWDATLRYSDAFQVNSGYYNSLVPNDFNNALKPYAPIPASTQMDLSFSYKLPISQKVTWSLNAMNIFDTKVSGLSGLPPIGRSVLTRLKYEF
jgi:outer membrane receptor for ferrienterochelin and colicins